MIEKIREKKGITGVDITIAIGIFVILTPIIMLIFSNIYYNTQSAKRNSEATTYITKIFEAVDLLYYDDVTVPNLELVKEGLDIPVRIWRHKYSNNTLFWRSRFSKKSRSYNCI